MGVAPATYSWNITTGVKLNTYVSDDPHPTGIVEHKGILYVLGQTNQMLYRYDTATATPLGSLVTFRDDYPEQIILGPCQSYIKS